MTITPLSHTSFDELLDCFLQAFENYFVKMPTEKAYYQQRWAAAKVDFDLSYGMFDEGKLVGFIIHGIDKRAGLLTAYNTGTGVIPAYRGKKIVKSIYAHAIPDLQQKGIELCTLEVIKENAKAIRSYESTGFRISKSYLGFGGNIEVEQNGPVELGEIPMQEVDWGTLPNQQYYSWDFQKETILGANYSFYQVFHQQETESYFIINPKSGMVAQHDLLKAGNQAWRRLFAGIKQVSEKIRIINVDERLKEKLDQIQAFGLENTVNQYQMELSLID